MQIDLSKLPTAPGFVRERIVPEVDKLIQYSDVIMPARAGDPLAADDFLLYLWPFVETFTDCVLLAKMRLLEEGIMTRVEWVFYATLLNFMHREEGVHAAGWAEWWKMRGHTLAQLEAAPLMPAVKELIASMGNEADLETVFAGFVTTEIIAWRVSVMLKTPALLALSGGGPIEWLDWHIDGADEASIPYNATHESACFGLWELVRERRGKRPLTYEEAREGVLCCADLFFHSGQEGRQHRLSQSGHEAVSA